MSYPLIELGNLAKFINGDRGKNYPSKDSFVQDGIPFINAGCLSDLWLLDKSNFNYISEESYGRLSSGKIQRNDILFCLRGSLGKFAVVRDDEKGALASSLVILRSNEKIHIEYLKHYLASHLCQTEINNYQNGAAQPNLSASDLKKFLIPLPPLEEQRRIASILDKADDIRQKRQQAIAKLDELLQATFIDMFGDPVSNPKKLKLKKLSEVGNISTGNTPSRADEDNYGDFIEWIKSDNLNHDYDIATQASEYLSEKGKQKGRVVPPGSILVTCIAGSLSCIGNLAIVDREVTFNQQINSITPNEDIQTEYLYYLLKVSKPIIQSFSTNSMKGMISKSTFSQIELPIAPSEQQLKFVDIFNKFFELKNKANKKLSELDNLFSALQQKAFNGTL
ncbi:restriction endonuclease subunit S [Acinetobacter sp. YH16044]|uniref:restriction endonuclease subunit S n=1 Tax=Acinetobacter sp. YH16044 TaxID=2601187 RepID=UPI0015D0E323